MLAGPENEIYIYAKMDAGLACQKLIKECEDHIRLEDAQSRRFREIKYKSQKLWHIRESNVPGMLTVDVVQWDSAGNKWEMRNYRLALTKNGWVNANIYGSVDPKFQNELSDLMAALQDQENVTPENASRHKASLEKYISEKLGLNVENRVNPLKSEQTTSRLYSEYIETGRAEVKLSPGVRQAITCEITLKPFKNPGVMNIDKIVRAPDGSAIHLRKGKSYEQEALESLGVTRAEFYPNFVLKKVVESIGSLDKLKIDQLDQRRLEDPVLLDQLKDPRILPSGHSYNQESIQGLIQSGRSLICPNTRIPFTREQVVKNENLELFLREWPPCKQTLLQTLERGRPSLIDGEAAAKPPAKL